MAEGMSLVQQTNLRVSRSFKQGFARWCPAPGRGRAQGHQPPRLQLQNGGPVVQPSTDPGGADSSPWTHHRECSPQAGTVPPRLEGSTSQTPQGERTFFVKSDRGTCNRPRASSTERKRAGDDAWRPWALLKSCDQLHASGRPRGGLRGLSQPRPEAMGLGVQASADLRVCSEKSNSSQGCS